MCSTKCDRPLSSVVSNRAPTLMNSAQTRRVEVRQRDRRDPQAVVEGRGRSRRIGSTRGTRRCHAGTASRTLQRDDDLALTCHRRGDDPRSRYHRRYEVADAAQEDRDRRGRRRHRAHGQHGAGRRGLSVPARPATATRRSSWSSAHDPDLLVLDVMMPRIDGLEVARRLKADVMWSRTPILMLTALAGIDDQVAGPRGRRRRLHGQAVRPARVRRAGQGADPRRAPRARPQPDHEPARARARSTSRSRSALKSGKPTAVVHIDIARLRRVRRRGRLRALRGGRASLGRVAARRGARASAAAARSSATSAARTSSRCVAPEHAEPFVDGAEARVRARKRDRRCPGRCAHALVAGRRGRATPRASVNSGADELGRRLGKAMKRAKAAGKTGHVVWSAGDSGAVRGDGRGDGRRTRRRRRRHDRGAVDRPRPRGRRRTRRPRRRRRRHRAIAPGDTLGRYEHRRRARRGRHGDGVSRARHASCAARSRSRCCSRTSREASDVVRRFQREARAAAGLEHRTSCASTTSAAARAGDDPPYIVMELVRGARSSREHRAARRRCSPRWSRASARCSPTRSRSRTPPASSIATSSRRT